MCATRQSGSFPRVFGQISQLLANQAISSYMNHMNQTPRIFHLMQLAHRALFRAADQRLHDALGITAVQQGALFVIARQEPCKPSAIAKMLDMNKSAVTTLVTRLETAGFIQRIADETDGRAQRISLTSKGKDAIRRSVPLTKQANAALLEGFEPHEVETIERFLTQVISTSARAASLASKGAAPTS